MRTTYSVIVVLFILILSLSKDEDVRCFPREGGDSVARVQAK